MTKLIDDLCNVYAEFSPELLSRLDEIYSHDIGFQDPLHEIQGLDQLRDYFAGMMTGLDRCRFEFDRRLQLPEQGECVLFWTMHYSHARLAGGKLLTLTGNSHLRYTDKIYYHRDYFDAGAMLYEHLPLLGLAIGYVKKRMAVK